MAPAERDRYTERTGLESETAWQVLEHEKVKAEAQFPAYYLKTNAVSSSHSLELFSHEIQFSIYQSVAEAVSPLVRFPA